ncbi:MULTISPECIES: adenosylcobinamide-GDP ribazoletransferase [Vibrio]|jgi:adenosylcobinamide-GDP ribazoletransferase|uniref:adenosylcobinamide-GDP ribazoletransferase n=1 Tax=Vibrio TaxID=662 RepID=UPI0002D51663|nr:MULTISPECIES: adenosylcobinamide-GDP ribazoletransferase [Vibrio]NOH94847.1 adenosylcobinamide-GDP ribazoletransferase [Vibrio sp. AIC-3]OED72766.1 adenosylcobinamide-GDP ribazoletransferase [Vibrio crassostreae ZF-91]OEE91659.1 adenosylcobinamide-GDP ribazoletransferase [Vibrio crassostreae 9ZC88]OEF05812.1 adenosylcobinamide-GDP ribazoletransferase [Vibrio crassostreae 9ZC77]PMK15536.1 adenosylcobinamide-GDP ribazoletransferase [Vibrio sp. 10N.261.54.E10]
MSDAPERSLKDRVTYQWELFALAMGFFSRLPMPKNTPYSTERMNRSGRYFSTVGLLLGVLCGGVFLLLDVVLPSAVAIFLMMSFSLMLTGAFHEDGLTDMADGIGGGMTLERRLTIMKDSRIGTYGASALIMALLGKWVLLNELISMTGLFMVIVTSYTFSRAIAASLIYDMPYVSDLDTSKSKPLANKQTKGELVFLLLVGVLPSLWFGLEFALVLSVVAYLFRTGFKTWLTARIGGFTGDCLGAAQQLMELLTYLVFITAFYNGFL